MRLDEKGRRYFQFRMCLNGKESMLQIGKYPEISLAQARKIADERQFAVEKQRQENRDAAFRDLLKGKQQRQRGRLGGALLEAGLHAPEEQLILPAKCGRKGTEFFTFREIAHVGSFLHNLIQRKLNASIDDEILFALLLQLVVPSRSASLVDAKWSSVNLQQGTWTVKPGRMKAGKFYSQGMQVAYLSPYAVDTLYELHQITGASEKLFPNLGSLPKPLRTHVLGSEIQSLGPAYPVEFGDFWCFFLVAAKKYSYFTPELVDQMLGHSLGDPAAPNYLTYLHQLRNLAEWWACTLEAVAWPKPMTASGMSSWKGPF